MVGRFWGTEIHLHASLLLLIPYTLLVFKPEDLIGAARVLLLITAIFVCVALHEMGHTLAARLVGIEVTSIILWPLGGVANLNRRPEKVLPGLAISAAGPLTNLLIFGVLAFLSLFVRLVERSMLLPGLSVFLINADIFPFLVGLAAANLSLALFNLVPVFPLDGGQIARGLLKLAFGEKRADLIMLIISLPLALLLTFAGVLARDPAIFLTGLILLLASITLNNRLTNGLMLAGLYFIDRGGFHLRRMDFDPAIREYTRAIQRSPNRAGLYVSRAVVYMNLGEMLSAQVDINSALNLDEHNYIAWTLRGELQALGKSYQAALASFNQAIQIHPTWATAYLDRGGVYQEMGNLPKALEDMDQGIEIGHGSPVGNILRSILRYQMGDLDGARADAEQAQRYAPQWMLVFPDIFLTNLVGHLPWALEYYWRAIEHMPNAYQSFQGRADACRVNGRADWAIADYERAIRLAPRRAELYLARGSAYQLSEDWEKAAEDFRQAVQIGG